MFNQPPSPPLAPPLGSPYLRSFATENFIFQGKNGCIPSYFFQKIGGNPYHQIFRRRPEPKNLVIRGYPQFFEKNNGGRPIFFPEKKTFRRPLTPSPPYPSRKVQKTKKNKNQGWVWGKYYKIMGGGGPNIYLSFYI